jgi:hypothetical protein
MPSRCFKPSVVVAPAPSQGAVAVCCLPLERSAPAPTCAVAVCRLPCRLPCRLEGRDYVRARPLAVCCCRLVWSDASSDASAVAVSRLPLSFGATHLQMRRPLPLVVCRGLLSLWPLRPRRGPLPSWFTAISHCSHTLALFHLSAAGGPFALAANTKRVGSARVSAAIQYVAPNDNNRRECNPRPCKRHGKRQTAQVGAGADLSNDKRLTANGNGPSRGREGHNGYG